MISCFHCGKIQPDENFDNFVCDCPAWDEYRQSLIERDVKMRDFTSEFQFFLKAVQNGNHINAVRRGDTDWCSIDAVDLRNGSELWARCSEDPIQPGFTPNRGEWFRVKDIEEA